MTTRAEDVLFASLTDIDALEEIAKFGLDPEVVPTKALRPMVAWAIDYYFDSGRRQAPSREMLMLTWGSVLEAEEVDLIDEDLEIDTVSSAIDSLVDHSAHSQWQTFIRDSAKRMAEAGPTTKAAVMTEVANELFEVTSRLQDRSRYVDAAQGFGDAYARYLAREEEGDILRGCAFGWDAIDQHVYGVHLGELAVMAAGPKVGKSYWMVRVLLHNWMERKQNVALASLENTVDMTMDRLACLYLGIDPEAWQRGKVTSDQKDMVHHFLEETIPKQEGDLYVFQPGMGQRTPERLAREARMRGSQILLVDQLTHVEHPDPGRKPRHELFNENIHKFSDLAKTGRDFLSIVVAHQINRAGIEAARKLDYLSMDHMAESAGVERAADWVFGLHQNVDERMARVARFQILAGRREDIAAWRIAWNPRSSQQRVISRVNADGTVPEAA